MRRQLGSHAGQYGLTWGSAVAINMLQGVLLMNILGEARYGVWLFLQFLMIYGTYHHLGVVNAVQRQLPLREGRGEHEAGRELLGAAQGLMLVQGVVFVAVGVGVSLHVYREYPWGAAAFLLATLFEVWTLLAMTVLKTQQQFLRAGGVATLRAGVNLGLLPLVFWLGLDGAYLRLAAVWALGLAVAWAWNPLRVRVRFSWRAAVELWQEGMPILLVGVVFAVQTSVDRLVIAHRLGEEALGGYGVAVLVMTVMLVLPGTVGQTSYPAMLQEYGRRGSARELWPRVLRRCGRVAGLASAVAAAGWLLLPPVVELLLPGFTGGVPAARWLLPGTVFVAASIPCSYFLQTIRRQRLHLVVNLLALAFHAGLVWHSLGPDGPLAAAARASSIAFAAYALVLLAVTGLLVRSGRGEGANA